MTHTSLADDDRLNTLTAITELVEKRTPLETASSQEILKEDWEFISKLMQLDLRDRPSAKVLLQGHLFRTTAVLSRLHSSHQQRTSVNAAPYKMLNLSDFVPGLATSAD